MTVHRVVIVGGGAAGTAAAIELRALGFAGPLTLVHGEEVAPYNRTTVNKMLLQPGAQLDTVRTAVPNDPRFELLTTRAIGLDTTARVVDLEEGQTLEYDAILIATGARPRRLPVRTVPADASRVNDRITYLRTFAEAERIRGLVSSVSSLHGRPARVAIAGASLLGSETADALQGLGHQVYLIDRTPNPLHRLVGATVAAWVTAQHRENLAAVIEATVDTVEAQDSDLTLGLSNGAALQVDLVIVAIGVTPDVDWLRRSPVALNDGVVVDDHLRAVDTDGVYAAGDLARMQGSPRIEHWGHALAQGQHAARTIGLDLQLSPDPGAFRAPGSYSSWLYGKGINVLGTPSEGDREIALAPPNHGAQVTVYVDSAGRLRAAVILGSGKLANRLRPVVTAGGTLDEAGEIITATLRPAASPI